MHTTDLDLDDEPVRPGCFAGWHAGFRWVATDHGAGRVSGGVRVPPGHPWHGKAISEIDAHVPGGLNWSKLRPRGQWFGFDCGLRLEPQGADRLRQHPLGEVDRSSIQRYVERQCRSLCEQAARAAHALGCGT